MRQLGIGAIWLALAVVVGGAALGSPAHAGIRRQEGTPVATAPAPTPAPPATTDVVTLVVWYATDPTGDFLVILPVQADAGAVAGPVPGAAAIGRSDFPETGPITITIGDSSFESYLRYAEDENEGRRWVWFNDEPEARPATLILQVTGLSGTYFNYNGTATFISRDAGGVGGLLVLALRPPIPAEGGDNAVPADTAAAGDEVGGEQPSDGAAEPDLTVEPTTEILDQPDVTPETGTEIIAEPDEEIDPPTEILDEESPPSEDDTGV